MDSRHIHLALWHIYRCLAITHSISMQLAMYGGLSGNSSMIINKTWQAMVFQRPEDKDFVVELRRLTW